ncbi:MAG: MBOAT family protein [Candidatus Hydrogenedentes bacterium]|nr:MBOAT family protein [Candidatus Hydrogenedentota bacterium]
MSFSSLQFGVFILIVYPLYLLLPFRWQNRMLLVASYIFDGAWDWRFLGLLWFTTLLDYLVGLLLGRIEEPGQRRLCIMASVVANLGVLGFFKYFNFFAGSLDALSAKFGIHLGWTTLNIILPVGVSFYTFQSMSYTIDVYFKHMKPTKSLQNFALYVVFFPQLVAGPIERAVDLVPRVERPRTVTLDGFARGVYLILFGLFKKIAISDGVAASVNAFYGTSGAVSGLDVVLATYLFAVQIYCDFSGYSDIARGLAKIMGFELMTNFNLPYFAVNPSEFWRRWHISLSTWLRDYLYIVLGGNRFGELKTYRNLMTTMVLGGLWHGAAWNFVLWGAYQGAILCVHRLIMGAKSAVRKPRSIWTVAIYSIQLILFFQVVCYGWLLFRARSFDQIELYTRALFQGYDLTSITVPRPPFSALVGLAILVVLEVFQYASGDAQFYRQWPRPVRGALYACVTFILLMGLSNAPTQFIYFQF